MTRRIVLGVHLKDRFREAPAFQELITEYGCIIRTRIGLHQVSDSICSTAGLILLEMFGDETRIDELEGKLRAFEDVSVQKMLFEE